MNTASTVANRFADAISSLLAHAAPNANSTDASNDPLASTTADFTDCEANNIAGLASASAARRQGPSCAAA